MKRYFLLFSVLSIGLASCSKSDVASQAAIDDQKIQAYITANHITGLTKDPKGYYYKIIITGSGAPPTSANTVKVSFTGSYLYGANFTSGSSESLVLSDAPSVGYQYGIEKIGVGGRIYMILPSALGYGTAGSSDASIPSNVCIIYTVDLLGYF